MINNAFFIGVDPVIFKIGPLTVSWYGLFIALAVVTVLAWMVWQNSKTHAFKTDALFMAALVGIPSGVIFSKLLHIIDNWNYYVQYPGRIFSGEGLAIWGAVLGGTLGIWAYSRISHQFRFILFGDMIAPGIILAQAVGRIGCTLNGCCSGTPTTSPIAIVYTNPNSYGPPGIPVWPTTIMEIVYNLIIFGVLLALRGHFKKEGTLFYIYLAFYATWRFAIDFIRDGSPFLFGLHEAQVISIVVLAITLPLIFIKNGWVKKSFKKE